MSKIVVEIFCVENKLKLKMYLRRVNGHMEGSFPTGRSKSAKPSVSSTPTRFGVSLPEPTQAEARGERSQGPGVHTVTWIQSKADTGTMKQVTEHLYQ